MTEQHKTVGQEKCLTPQLESDACSRLSDRSTLAERERAEGKLTNSNEAVMKLKQSLSL